MTSGADHGHGHGPTDVPIPDVAGHAETWLGTTASGSVVGQSPSKSGAAGAGLQTLWEGVAGWLGRLWL